MMQYCDTILKCGILITQNQQRSILRDVSLAIRNGTILDIQSTDTILASYHAGEVLDYGHDLVMPGLINAHVHAPMTFLRGKADDLPLMKWLHENVFPIEACLTPDIVFLGTLLGYAEMLATGTTACVDMYMFEEEVIKAAEKSGIRCMGGEAIFAFPSASSPSFEAALEKTADLAHKYKSHPRISIAVNPHSVYTTTPQILERCAEMAFQNLLPVHIHLAETEAETAESIARYGKRPIEYAMEILGDVPLIAAHLVDMTEEESAKLAAIGTIGVHNPSSNMKLASGAAPIVEALENGLAFALGTDGPASNNQLNMFVEMRQAALLQKLIKKDPAAMTAATVLDMATIYGGKCMRLDGLGTLKIGAPADCIVLDLDAPNLQPLYEPISQVVYAASGHECKMTMIAGEVVFKDGSFPRFDYKGLLKEADKLKDFANKKA